MWNLGEMRTEGPFGDHTGFYSLEGEYPVFHVECITHRKDPIYLTTIVGPPPQEDYFMGYAVERVFLAGDEDAVSGDCGRGDAGGRNFSQFDDCGDPESLSGPRAKNHECDLVAGAGDVHEGDSGGGSRRERADCAKWCGRRCARSTRSEMCNSCWGPWIRWITPRGCRTTGRRWESTPTRKWAERRIYAGDGRTKSRWIRTQNGALTKFGAI